MDLLRRMLAPSPALRLSAAESLAHPTFNQMLSKSPLIVKKLFDAQALVQHTMITEEFAHQPRPVQRRAQERPVGPDPRPHRGHVAAALPLPEGLKAYTKLFRMTQPASRPPPVSRPSAANP